MKKCLIYSFLLASINIALHQTAIAQQVLGDFTTGDTFEWPKLTWLRDLDNSWDEGLIKMAANTSGIARAGFGIHMNANRQFTFWSSGFNPLLSIEGGTGNTYIKGRLGIGVLNPSESLDVGGRITALGLNMYTQGGEKTINFASSVRNTYLYGNVSDFGLYDNLAGGIYTYNFESDRFYINKKTFFGNSISFSGDPNLMNNIYYDNAFRYVGNGPGSQIAMNANSNGGLGFYTALNNNAGAGAVADMKERMSITNQGNVGIGYGSPDAPLGILSTDAVIRMVAKDVKSFDIGTHADGVFTIGDYGRRIFNINYAENVGIGTLNPGAKLEIQQQSSGWTTMSRVNAINPGEINGFKFYSGYLGEDKWAGISSVAENLHSNSTGLSIYTNQSEKVRISADGKVGIGTSLPESKLRVVGGGVVVGRNATFNDTDGNISIGDISMNSSPNTGNWTYGTNMLISGLDFTTIGFHDAGERVDFIRSGKGKIELGYDGGWGHANIGLPNGIWNASGNVGLGTVTPSERLTVNGKIKANEIRVDGNGQPDYVFEEEYKILSLKETEQYIKLNKHLPEIPSAAEAAENGIALGEMNKLLLKKIEELTLHLIEKDKQYGELLNDVKKQELRLRLLEKKLDK